MRISAMLERYSELLILLRESQYTTYLRIPRILQYQPRQWAGLPSLRCLGIVASLRFQVIILSGPASCHLGQPQYPTVTTSIIIISTLAWCGISEPLPETSRVPISRVH